LTLQLDTIAYRKIVISRPRFFEVFEDEAFSLLFKMKRILPGAFRFTVRAMRYLLARHGIVKKYMV
jgi:hypothetical protein